VGSPESETSVKLELSPAELSLPDQRKCDMMLKIWKLKILALLPLAVNSTKPLDKLSLLFFIVEALRDINSS
jgi:hypothetical protein